jgi:four helix bundle protein
VASAADFRSPEFVEKRDSPTIGTECARAQDVNDRADALKARTKRFALKVLSLVELLPAVGPAAAVGGQLTHSGTSVAANYRAACRARSKAEFAAKIGVVLEEADESLFWLEIIAECGYDKGSPSATRLVQDLLKEADELVAIFVASNITCRESLTRDRQRARTKPGDARG